MLFVALSPRFKIGNSARKPWRVCFRSKHGTVRGPVKYTRADAIANAPRFNTPDDATFWWAEPFS